MVDVIVRSWLSCDGFECEGKSYKLDQIQQLKDQIAGRAINWVKGKNTFSGKLVSDSFMESMKKEVM